MQRPPHRPCQALSPHEILLLVICAPLLLFASTDEVQKDKQESRAVARKSRDAAAVPFGLKFAHNIHYKFKSRQALKARLQSSKRKTEFNAKWPIEVIQGNVFLSLELVEKAITD